MKMQEKQFRIGELAKYIGVERFVIRFWEKEFGITSHRSSGGQRFYVQKDVQTFKAIKKLLHKEGFTIAGAKQQLANSNTAIIASNITTMIETNVSKDMIKELNEIRAQLIILKNSL